MKDVSNWEFKGFGGGGTLPMEILLSPDGSSYYMKYAWISEKPRTHLEDVNEVIAAKIAHLLKLNVIKAEIAYRNGKRGCLSLDYVEQYNANEDEAGAVLLESELGQDYHHLQKMLFSGLDLVRAGFNLMENFSYFNKIRSSFIAMNLFDILIGNQDRHPFNWAILFKNNKSYFAPLYDNGASLGFQLPDDTLAKMNANTNELENYYYKMKVKAGIFCTRKAPLKAANVLSHCILHYKDEVEVFKEKLSQFQLDKYDQFIDQFPLISNIRKEFLKVFIRHRIEKILKANWEGI